MNVSISAERLRSSLRNIVKRVRKGTRFTVIYKNRPAFQLVPVDDTIERSVDLADDPLYRAQSVGRSTDGQTTADHNFSLYP